MSDLIDYDQLALTISLKVEKVHKNKLGLAQQSVKDETFTGAAVNVTQSVSD